VVACSISYSALRSIHMNMCLPPGRLRSAPSGRLDERTEGRRGRDCALDPVDGQVLVVANQTAGSDELIGALSPATVSSRPPSRCACRPG
jgi:hypothetical protein